MNKVITKEQAAGFVRDGHTIMVGDFLGSSTPECLMDALVESGVKDLTLISCTTGNPVQGCGKLVMNRRVKKAITTHIGTNKETGRQLINGEMEIEFVPQGTLAERIRCGGAGLGGVLTQTGLGTPIEEGKRKVEVNGEEYLLETPLRADVALIKAYKADGKGNLIYRLVSQNMNTVMAMAADVVIAEVEEIVPVGTIPADAVVTPGPLVDYLVVTEEGADMQ
jgi:acetate CoA/acetoacetate CoA-transferase alpha subunit